MTSSEYFFLLGTALPVRISHLLIVDIILFAVDAGCPWKDCLLQQSAQRKLCFQSAIQIVILQQKCSTTLSKENFPYIAIVIALRRCGTKL